MPTVRKETVKPIAVLCSDLHLSLTAPACRADPDWLHVQAEYLGQLREFSGRRNLPVLCAGDIFDRWNAPPELINFALEHLPDGMICIPGQHDLPGHNLNEMHRSGYGVLVKANKIIDVSDGSWRTFDDFFLKGFPWGNLLSPSGNQHGLKVALIHKYIWMPDFSYPGAPKESMAIAVEKELGGYDVAVFGDNHIHFSVSSPPCHIWNCGGFIRRKSDEIAYQPSVGILHSDGSIKRHRLDTSIDRFHPKSETRDAIAVNMKEFIQSLESLGEHGLDFREAVKRHLASDKVENSVRGIVLEAIEHHD